MIKDIFYFNVALRCTNRVITLRIIVTMRRTAVTDTLAPIMSIRAGNPQSLHEYSYWKYEKITKQHKH